jgi:hypothetical protein
VPDAYGVRVHPCSLRFGDESLRTGMRWASSPDKVAVRISGGSGRAEEAHRVNLCATFRTGFAGCRGAIVIGGTQMRRRDNLTKVVMGITEVAPAIAEVAPEAVIIGVTPRICDLTLIDGVGAMVSNGKHPGEPDRPYITIIHPDLNVCLLLQYSADIPLKSWREEWKAALRYMGLLREESQPPFRTAHVFYNGGAETEQELLGVVQKPFDAANPWWVVLVSNSGRTAQKYAEDDSFRSHYADRLVVCTKTDLRRAMQDLGMVPD